MTQCNIIIIVKLQYEPLLKLLSHVREGKYFYDFSRSTLISYSGCCGLSVEIPHLVHVCILLDTCACLDCMSSPLMLKLVWPWLD